MEEIIKIQVSTLYEQRAVFVRTLSQLDENGMQYFTANNELRQSVDKIDMEIASAVTKLEIFLNNQTK